MLPIDGTTNNDVREVPAANAPADPLAGAVRRPPASR